MLKHSGLKQWITTLGLACLMVAWPEFAAAASRSDLSRWLSDEAGTELGDMLSLHPRFAGRTVTVQSMQHNGLAEAISITLKGGLSAYEGVRVAVPRLQISAPSKAHPAIDVLDCQVQSADALLTVDTQTLSNGALRVELALYDDATASAPAHSWQWLGRLSGDELRVLREAPSRHRADGTLDAPWAVEQASLAAQVLHRELACALRPVISRRLVLDWQVPETLPSAMADTVNHARRLVAGYSEIGLAANDADYTIQPALVPFQKDTWQLQLRAVPRRAGLHPVDAATYFSLPGFVPPTQRPPQDAPVIAGVERGPAIDHLRVELLDVLQGKARYSRAPLEVQFRISNTSPWPIEYAFSLSGGHYQHCVPEPGYYRHDRYGYVEGRLDAGESLVRRMVIEGARHNPNPWFGPPRCAGFRSLEGFEDFSGKGRSITQFVHWANI